MNVRNTGTVIAALDAGNTHIRAAFSDGKEIFPGIKKICTDKNADPDEISNSISRLLDLDGRALSGAIYSSVAPELNAALDSALERITGTKPLCVSSSMRLDFTLHYDPPSSLGADRIANASAAFEAYPSRNIVLVDAGTAVTFCVLLEERVFDGGLIVPGAGLAAEALSLRTSKLPLVDVFPGAPIVGRTTRDGIRGGLLHGWASMIEGITSRIESSYGRSFLLLITGGGAAPLKDQIRRAFVFDELLTMKGLFRLYNINRR